MGEVEKSELSLLNIGECFEYLGSFYIIVEETTIYAKTTINRQPEIGYFCQDEAGLYKKFVLRFMVTPVTQSRFAKAEEDYGNDNADMIRPGRSPRIDTTRLMRGGPNRWR